jgi:hypothetical protein
MLAISVNVQEHGAYGEAYVGRQEIEFGDVATTPLQAW